MTEVYAGRDPEKFFLGKTTSWIATSGVPVKYIYPPPRMKADWCIPVFGDDCDDRAAEICELLNRKTYREAEAEADPTAVDDAMNR